MTNSRIEQLKQLLNVTWDGNLISKHDRDELIKNGWADKREGWNFLTNDGIKILIQLGELRP